MLKLTCPYCGVEGEETEFAPLGTVTLEVFGTYEAQTMRPPDALLEKIKAKRPDWPGFGDV